MNTRTELRLLVPLAPLFQYEIQEDQGKYMIVSDASSKRGATMYALQVPWHPSQKQLVSKSSNNLILEVKVPKSH